MKRIAFLTLSLLFAFSGVYAQKKKVAVVTFYVDKYVDASDLGSGAALISSISTLADDPNFDLKPVLGKFHDVFFKEYAKSFPFELLPEEKVINNEEYKAYESKFGETSDEDRKKLFQRYVTHEGYKPLSQMVFSKKENRNHTKMLEIFGDDVDGVMFVYLSYAFARKPLPMTAGVRGYVNIKLWNKEGKKVFAINEFGMSKKTIAVVGGIPIMKPEKLMPLCESASEKVIRDLGKRLKKVARKSAKKL